MAVLKTNYVDDVLDASMTNRQFNMTNNSNGTVSLKDASLYSVRGDEFGADDINATNRQVNSNTSALNGNDFYWDENGKPWIRNASTGKTKKLGSSDGTATTSQVLSGATFNSKNTKDNEDYSTGTMKNNSGNVVNATTVTNDKSKVIATIPETAYYDTTSKVAIPQSKVNDFYVLGSGNSYNIKSLFPTEYSRLRTSNFFLIYNGLSMSGWQGGLPGNSTSADIKVNISASAPSLSYDYTTGILTVNSGSISAYGEIFQGSGNGSKTSTYTGSVGHKVCVVLGSVTNM